MIRYHTDFCSYYTRTKQKNDKQFNANEYSRDIDQIKMTNELHPTLKARVLSLQIIL